jgi:RND family efflux transporter MFP subunit
MRRSGCALFWMLLACSQPHDAPGAKPAASPPTRLEDLGTLVLTEASVAALGLDVARVEPVSASQRLLVGGEVMVPAGRDVALAAPASGRIAAFAAGAFPRPGERVRAGQVLLSLIPLAAVDRDVGARAKRELDTAQADLTLAAARVARAQSMLADHSGSQRNLDEANAQHQVATATLRAAQARLASVQGGSLDSDVSLPVRSPVDGIVRAIRVTAGQSVPQGAALIEVAGTGRWVRATLAASDVATAAAGGVVHAARIGSRDFVELAEVVGPPSADPLRGTVDRFFMLPESVDWTPGERVLVELLVALPQTWLAVPFDSVVRDAEGGAWVYEQREPLRFRRRRVEPVRRDGERLLLTRGVAVGSSVVRAGAIELWGYELGADR